jgi:hypothetical protein
MSRGGRWSTCNRRADNGLRMGTDCEDATGMVRGVCHREWPLVVDGGLTLEWSSVRSL